ncbi:protein of unknown function DUF909 [Beutenbergia cavernae DSM 12333]|uniref:ESAT-6-like protein n=1 Tax=Beutenbergia cavernae (strain ATCC BAA-8 / DSM 12333 / CCUG 43141 / JCM 11478 / NBRC 16432 / NCIMB 13614 / HKI 0122) TaxID=471853 RepID=C5C0Q3_BEUC1|nr:WXG100 family type VII secretion target [Beutenbergia cavernae]ACQ81449.1 protein of unknown function DUF909 [Beutenbergia cavernae DSM 12333]ACQ81454.1 protein of unknown function DUF909 [Beutenbergia cavernae DSM 12333]
MAGEISAADGALKAGADVVATTRTELRSELSALEGKLSGLGAQWQGLGAAAFTNLMNRWREDATKIIDALNEFEAKLNESQTAYTSTDDASQATMSRLQGRLG